MKTSNKASILIASIWVLVFFAILSSAIYKIFYSQINIAKRIQERITAQFCARAAVLYAQKQLKTDETSYDTLSELNKIWERNLGMQSFSFSLIDEERKININSASVKTLAKLLDIDEELAKEIASFSLKPYLAKEELLLIEDINQEKYDSFKDYITVFGNGWVNINTASKLVFLSLGMDEDLAEKIIGFRSGPDGVEGNEDDSVFENTGDITGVLKGYSGLSMRQENLLNELINSGKICVGSEYFTLVLETKLLGKTSLKYYIIFTGSSILQWREF